MGILLVYLFICSISTAWYLMVRKNKNKDIPLVSMIILWLIMPYIILSVLIKCFIIRR